MHTYKTGVNRDQANLFPPRLEDYVDENNPVRAIDAYVECLDLVALGFIDVQTQRSAAGQPSYSPASLLKLYIYGYINRIRSSRALEKACHRNVEVMWLIEGVKPCYKTIADFRKNNPTALRQTHKDFILICKELDLIGGKKVAVDGSFFNGNVSDKSFVTTKGLKTSIDKLETQIGQWLAQLDEMDSQPNEELEIREDLARKVEELKALQCQKRLQHEEWVASGKSQESRVDSDARLLSKRSQKVAGYNVQIVTDEREKLIIADEVVNDPNDLQQLYPMAEQAKQRLGVEALEVLADAGYYNAAQIACCESQGLRVYVAVPEKNTGRTKGRYTSEEFRYDPLADVYHCPANAVLDRSGQPRLQSGSFVQRYVCSERICTRCEQRQHCITQKSRCREIWRNEHDELLQQHRQRLNDNPQVIRARSALVEHPFGTLKRRAGWDHFLLRGFRKVRGEWSLMALSYNFTRVLNCIGLDKFRSYCEQRVNQQMMNKEECHLLFSLIVGKTRRNLRRFFKTLSSTTFSRRNNFATQKPSESVIAYRA